MIEKLQSRLKISQLRSSVYIASINKMTTTTGTNAFTIPTLISLSSKIFQSTTIILEYFSSLKSFITLSGSEASDGRI